MGENLLVLLDDLNCWSEILSRRLWRPLFLGNTRSHFITTMEPPKKKKCNKYCLGCSFRTIKYNQFGPKNNKTFQTTEEGLTCSHCKCLLYKVCAAELYRDLSKKPKHYHNDCTPFLNGLETKVSYGCTKHPKNFTGHCCLIRTIFPAPDDTSLRHPSVKSNRLPPLYSIGGGFCLPEFELLLPIDQKSMDFFGVGKDEGVDARLHYVIKEAYADAIHARGGVFPS